MKLIDQQNPIISEEKIMPLNYSVRNFSRKLRSRINIVNFCIPVYLLIQLLLVLLLLVLLLPVFFLVDIFTCGMFGDKNLYTYIGGERALPGIFGHSSAATISHQSDDEESTPTHQSDDPGIEVKLSPNAPDNPIDSRDDLLPPPYSEI